MVSPASMPPAAPQGVLLLSEDDVRRVLTMETALEAVEQALRKMALDEAQNVPRARVQTDHAMLHTMSAAAKSLGILGAKVYATNRKGQATCAPGPPAAWPRSTWPGPTQPRSACSAPASRRGRNCWRCAGCAASAR